MNYRKYLIIVKIVVNEKDMGFGLICLCICYSLLIDDCNTRVIKYLLDFIVDDV